VTKYDGMEEKDLREELKRLQREILSAEQTAMEAREKAAEATKAYTSALFDQKPDALLRMIEADAASRKPLDRYRQIRSDFDVAKRAYLHALLAQ
jgi:septal ring factor EnvC (AmiA/AmiB activator)